MRASTGTYAGPIAQGERDAFADRKAGMTREMREHPLTEEERGYWDAYSPRSATWDVRQKSPFKTPTFDMVPA